jgi:Glycosyl hydrolases family 15
MTTSSYCRTVATACAVTLSLLASAPSAGANVAPHASASALVSSNGESVIVYDTTQHKITTFLEHPYQAQSNGAQTRNFAYDEYPGLRLGGAGQPGTWLTDVAPSSVEYVPGTGIIHAVRSWQGLAIDEYQFCPIDLTEHAFVTLIHVARTSGSAAPLDAFTLFNFHLGSGAPNPGTAGEDITWDATRGAWIESGPSGAALGYGSIGASTHHSASPDNPFPLLGAGSNLTDNAGTGGSFDDAAAGLQWSLGSPASGQSAWAGSFVVLDSSGNVAPDIDAVQNWIAGRTPAQVLSDEQSAWQSWQTPPPSGASASESALYAQSEAVLRMAQVSEPGKPNGQILASLPPGEWNIAWVRDMAYGAVALARSGHIAEAKRAIAFQLGADSDHYEAYVGRPYQISVVRYFGDGVEQSDSNQDGPNIEFDGFGLFLWELDAYEEASHDTASLTTWWPTVSQKVADVLVALQEPDGLISPDSSIWEVHWDGQQKSFAYTTIAAARGLCLASQLATDVGDAARAATYLAAGKRARDALIQQLSAPDGQIAQSYEDLRNGAGYLDAAAIEAVNFGLISPTGRAAHATLSAIQNGLAAASGHGFFRNDDGGSYDNQEWVFIDLRTSDAMRRMSDNGAAPLLGWVTDQSADNFDLLSELYDPSSGDYAGAMPMVGFGAGAYVLALLDRAGPALPPPCGDYAPENANGDAGTDAGADASADASSDASGDASRDAGRDAPPSPGSDAASDAASDAPARHVSSSSSGCGCRIAGGTNRRSAGALVFALGALGWAWRRRTA